MTAFDDDPGSNGELDISVVHPSHIGPQYFDVYPVEGEDKTVNVKLELEIDRESLLLTTPNTAIVLGNVYRWICLDTSSIQGEQLWEINDHPCPMSVLFPGNTIFFKVTVKAEDRGQPPLSTTCFLLVEVLDVNDNKPIFDENAYETIISKDKGNGQRIIRVFAVDDDEGDNAVVSYAIQGVNPSCPNCFVINQGTGWITKGSGTLNPVSLQS